MRESLLSQHADDNALPLFVLQGATASGKSDVALALASMLPIEIISADSRQVYRYLDIGTAKPTHDELAAVPHHLVDIINPDEAFSAGTFAEQARLLIPEVYARKAIPVVVGGTGLYIQALCGQLFQEPEQADYSAQRIALQQRLEQEGKDALYAELERVDPVSALKYADKNPRRVLRALEYYSVHKMPLSQAHAELNRSSNLNVTYFAVHRERSELYERINQRSTRMWEQGLPQETQAVLHMGYTPELNALNTVGYKEAIAFIHGDISAERGIELTAQNTRRYAKRQLTWLRNNGIDYHYLHGTTVAMAVEMKVKIEQRLRL